MKTEETSSPLWEIVHSLTSSEKRYIKIELLSKKAAQSELYVKLFDELDKQEIYDEQSLKKKLGTKFSFSNFAVVKAKLYDTILVSLINFHQENNIDLALHKMLSVAEVLKLKSNNEAAWKELTKALAVAMKYERFGLALDMKQRLSLMQLESGDMKAVSHYNDTENETELRITRSLSEIITSKKIAAQTILLAKKFGGLTQHEGNEALKKIRTHPLLHNIGVLQTFHAKMYSRTTLGVLLSLEKQIDASLNNRLELHQMFEQFPHFIADKIQLYTGNLYNICVTYLTLEQIKECKHFLDLLETITKENKGVFSDENLALTRLRVCNLRLQLCAHTAVYDELKAIIEEVQQIEKNYGNRKLEEFIMSSFTFAAMLFYLAGKYNDSLDYVNRLLNLREKELRKDMMLYARFLVIALHYKMDNHVLIEYELKNLRYFLHKNFTEQELGKRFADFFHLLLHNKNKLQKKRSQYLPLFSHAGQTPNVYERMFDAVVESVIK